MQLPVPSYPNIAYLAYTVIAAGVGSFAGSFLKKMGENFATREDFNNLLAQVRQTTETTKAIEGRISDSFLQKQQRPLRTIRLEHRLGQSK